MSKNTKRFDHAAQWEMMDDDWKTVQEMEDEGIDETPMTKLKDGHHTVRWSSGNVYTGDVLNQEMHGKGTIKFKNGEEYTGDFVHNERHGSGTVDLPPDPNGALSVVKFTGGWEHGRRIGEGVTTFSNSDVYEGPHTLGGKFNGEGKMTFADGRVYTGTFVDSTRNGKGRMKMKTGDVYEGDFVRNKMHGTGTVTYAVKGKSFQGQFQDGRRVQGRMVFPDGKEYAGGWKTDKPHGDGTCRFKCGDVYRGEWAEGRMQGSGHMEYNDGKEYKGEWKADRPHGQGWLKMANGAIIEGLFENGRSTNVTTVQEADSPAASPTKPAAAAAPSPSPKPKEEEKRAESPAKRETAAAPPPSSSPKPAPTKQEEPAEAPAAAPPPVTRRPAQTVVAKSAPPPATASRPHSNSVLTAREMKDLFGDSDDDADTTKGKKEAAGAAGGAPPPAQAKTAEKQSSPQKPSEDGESRARAGTATKKEAAPANGKTEAANAPPGGHADPFFDGVSDGDDASDDGKPSGAASRTCSIPPGAGANNNGGVNLGELKFEGWMEKYSIGKSFFSWGNWKKRYFRLCERGLAYYPDEKTGAHLGIVPTHTIGSRLVSTPTTKTHKEAKFGELEVVIIYQEEVSAGKHPKEFRLLLRCMSSADKKGWAAALSKQVSSVDLAGDF